MTSIQLSVRMAVAASTGQNESMDLGVITVPCHCPPVTLDQFSDGQLMAELAKRLDRWTNVLEAQPDQD